MKTETAFWDTSAIIPLFCNQVMSKESRRIRRRFGRPVLWWGTQVEVHSEVNRLLRDGLLSERQSNVALEKWNTLRSIAFVVLPDDDVLKLAVSLTTKHNIRSLDAFQLASALVWCGERPRNKPFICADKRLGDAASDAGFDVPDIA